VAQYRFGSFELDVGERRLVRAGEPVHLQPKAFDLLVYLVERSGHLVDKQRILDDVWSGSIVTDHSLTQCIRQIRVALADDHERPSYIETVPRAGYRFIAAPAASDPVQASAMPRRYMAAAGLATIVVLVGLAALIWPTFEPPPAESTGDTVLVRPFAAEQSNDAYLGDALAEELIRRLSRSGSVNVLPYASPFVLDAADYLLEGSVHRDGDRIHISARLDDASGTQLWAARFDRQLDSLFDIQHEIAEAVVAHVASAFAPDTSSNAPTRDVDAYVAYLRGREVQRARGANWVGQAIDAYRLAMDLDPQYAEAWAAFGTVGLLRSAWSASPERERELARAAIDQALMLEPELPEARAALGLYFSMSTQPEDVRLAERELRQALASNPRMIDAYNWLSVLLSDEGRFAEADETMNAALAIDPLNALLNLNLARGELRRGEYLPARQRMLAVLRGHDPPSWAYEWYAELECEFGHHDLALRGLEHGLERGRKGRHGSLLGSAAMVFARVGLFEEAHELIARTEAADLDTRIQLHAYVLTLEGRYEELDAALQAFASRAGVPVAALPEHYRESVGIARVLGGAADEGVKILETTVGTHFRPYSGPASGGIEAWHYLAWGYSQNGRDEDARRVLEDVRAILAHGRANGLGRSPMGEVTWARTQAMLGHNDQALAALQRAVDLGWRDYYLIWRDPRWGAFAETPGFSALLTRIESDLGPLRTRIKRDLPILSQHSANDQRALRPARN
jgi:DNA-binding winged helix-turn-helix (wHTH) protein/TolB-like protein/tetratricopeptide (TPR) repeat protein